MQELCVSGATLPHVCCASDSPVTPSPAPPSPNKPLPQAWPATLRTVYNDHERYETNYFKPFPGYYFSGDGARRDKDGYIWITGRVDDVINVSGHRCACACVRVCAGRTTAVLPCCDSTCS